MPFNNSFGCKLGKNRHDKYYDSDRKRALIFISNNIHELLYTICKYLILGEQTTEKYSIRFKLFGFQDF